MNTSETRNWTVHVGRSFSDVPSTDSFYTDVETIFHHGITLGYGNGLYGSADSTERAQMTASESRELIASYIPPRVADREGWAADIYTPMSVLKIPLTPDTICAVVSITEQESGFQVDPPIPNLAAIAWAEIERRRERIGIPKFALDTALALQSSNGKTYRERIDSARTERNLSDVFEDMIGRVPLGRTFFEDRNPVRTGGPMQVGVAFAREHVKARPYPYAVVESLRDEVFTRRGGMYFGIAHLLDYDAPYDRYIYRYADFNAGQYASRNAAFQSALGLMTGTKLALDGDLLVPGRRTNRNGLRNPIAQTRERAERGRAES